MKAKVIETGEMVDVYHEPQHGQITNIYKESVLVNGRMWTEDELDFCVKTNKAPEKIYVDADEEPVSEDLEEYSALIADELPQGIVLTSNGEFDITSVRKLIIDACKHGAQWQKEKMMKDVVLETTVIREMDGDAEDFNEVECAYYENPEIIKVPEWAQNGDKVKVIIIKSE